MAIVAAPRDAMAFTMSTATSGPTVYLIPIGHSREQAADYVSVGTTLFDTLVEDGRMIVPMINDAIVLRDVHKPVTKVDALSDGDECVRIELSCAD
jgi:hypothetical protein